MITRLYSTRVPTLVILVIVAVFTVTAVLGTRLYAHEGRNVGDYNFVVGFLTEPAYEGQLNAVSLVVTRVAQQETASQDAPASNTEMDGQATAHDHDGHSHSHDDENTQSPSTANHNEADVLTHGAVFISPGIGRNEAFRFEITAELSGLGIPYHIHPGDHQGTIIVSEEDARDTAEKTIVITKDAIEPKRIDANVGDTVVWMNHEYQNTVIMSGPLSSMTSEMKSMIEADTSVANAEAQSSVNRVTGLSTTLEVELTHLSTSTAKVMSLTEVFDDPGHYIAEFIPTAPGDYRVRFFGSIKGNPIDETFDSGPDTFDTVIASDAIQFPYVLESNREIRNAAQGALNAVQDLETDLESTSSTASVGMIIGIVGILVGLVAIGTSLFAISIVRRRN